MVASERETERTIEDAWEWAKRNDPLHAQRAHLRHPRREEKLKKKWQKIGFFEEIVESSGGF